MAGYKIKVAGVRIDKATGKIVKKRVFGYVSVNGVHLDLHTPPQMARTSY